MDSNDVASLDAQQKMGPKDYALMLHTRQLPPSPTLTRFTGQSAVRLIGRCDFSKYQVQYLLFNLAYPKGINTIREMVLVMRHKWPKQFKSLLESDLELLIQWLYPNPPALQSSIEVGGINDYKYGLKSLDPEGGWNRYLEKQLYASGHFASSHLVNAFKLDLRDAEVHEMRLVAKRNEPRAVQNILATKLFSDLSSIDIALGLSRAYSHLDRGSRYKWMFPFTEKHVEIIWRGSLLSQTKTLKMVSKMDRQSPNFKRNFGVFKEHVEAGRVDETLKLDPQSCGNERIAGNFADEITRIFLSHFDSENRNRLEALMAE